MRLKIEKAKKKKKTRERGVGKEGRRLWERRFYSKWMDSMESKKKGSSGSRYRTTTMLKALTNYQRAFAMHWSRYFTSKEMSYPLSLHVTRATNSVSTWRSERENCTCSCFIVCVERVILVELTLTKWFLYMGSNAIWS